VAATFILVAMVGTIFVFLCFQGYGTTLQTTEARAQRAAAVVAEGTYWILSASLASLETASAQVAGGMDPDEVGQMFSRAAAMLPAQTTLFVYSAAGKLTSLASRPASDDIADTDYFKDLARGASVSLGVQQGDGDAASFSVARRVERDGLFLGAVVASLPQGVLARFALPQDLGAGSTVSVVRNDGWVIARDPALDRPLDLSGTHAMEQLSGAASGAYVSEASPVDGVARIVGFQRVDALGYIAVASISQAVAFGGL
jgi:hypothetical protein